MSDGAEAEAEAVRELVLPAPRGKLTERLFAELRGRPDAERRPIRVALLDDPLGDDDLQLALYVCYELHYARIREVDERWEWSPWLLAFRAALESQMERGLAELAPRKCSPAEADDVGGSLQRAVADDAGPPLSRHLELHGDLEHVIEHVIHRSAYQLKEADPHSWAIPRLVGAPKAALLEIQADEYGGGNAERMHSALFERTMLALGLDAAYGAYLDLLPGITLASVNAISLWGLHRRLRGALVGHLAAFEMTSSIPNRRYGNALRRLGLDSPATDFYDEHVVADAVHESIAAWDLADRLASVEPQLAEDILFGARALLALEARWAGHLLDSWERGGSSLRDPVIEAATA